MWRCWRSVACQSKEPWALARIQHQDSARSTSAASTREIGADVGADLWPERVGLRPGDLQEVDDPVPVTLRLDAMDRPHHHPTKLRLVDETLGLNGLRDPQLDRVLVVGLTS
jgi:hypothetical protein